MGKLAFLLVIDDEGNGTFQMVHNPVYEPVDAFPLTQLPVGDILNLHVANGGQKRLVKVAVLDDMVPAFSSPEEADAWLEQRSGEISVIGQ